MGGLGCYNCHQAGVFCNSVILEARDRDGVLVGQVHPRPVSVSDAILLMALHGLCVCVCVPNLFSLSAIPSPSSTLSSCLNFLGASVAGQILPLIMASLYVTYFISDPYFSNQGCAYV